MRRVAPLPAPLKQRAFFAAELVDYDQDRRRAHRSDIVPLGSGVFIPRDLAATLDGEELYYAKATALARRHPEAWLSHATAARFWGFPLPQTLMADDVVHLSFAVSASRPTRAAGTVAHRSSRGAWRTVRLGGVPCSAVEQLWTELAEVLPVKDLVVLGDHLIRHPYHWAEKRRRAYVTVSQLREVTESQRFRGKQKALQALDLIRVGADSPKETLFRLALHQAGLPEPQLQVSLNPKNPRSRRGDLGYPGQKVVIQYDGRTHFTPEQARADQRRDNEFVAAGWLVLRLNVEDDRGKFTLAVAQVRAALRQRGLRC